jgi:hypothetical protein
MKIEEAKSHTMAQSNPEEVINHHKPVLTQHFPSTPEGV